MIQWTLLVVAFRKLFVFLVKKNTVNWPDLFCPFAVSAGVGTDIACECIASSLRLGNTRKGRKEIVCESSFGGLNVHRLLCLLDP